MKKIMTSGAEGETTRGEGSKPRVRDRIFGTACELFYRQGIRAVGVDAIACEAGTNKMSFYRSFPSKDELVAEYLRDAERKFWLWWDNVVAQFPDDPRAQTQALFDTYAQSVCISDKDRGCAMANAAVELRDSAHPGMSVVRAHKSEIRRRFQDMARRMAAREPEVLGDALTMLMQGAYNSRLIFPDGQGPAASVAKAARTLIEAYLRPAAPLV
jgi:AcrR family transcriptional regulator